jgi:hypothetical protein
LAGDRYIECEIGREAWEMINQLIDIIGREAALFESFLELLEEQ